MKTRVFYTITFDVGARVYTTKPQKAQGLDGSSVAIGQEALVHYDPSDPRKSWVEGEKTPLAATIQFVFFLWAFAAAMVGITALAARSAKAEQAKRQAGVAEG